MNQVLSINNMLLVDDQVIIQRTEGSLLRVVHQLHVTYDIYTLRLSPGKSKVMTFSGRHLVE